MMCPANVGKCMPVGCVVKCGMHHGPAMRSHTGERAPLAISAVVKTPLVEYSGIHNGGPFPSPSKPNPVFMPPILDCPVDGRVNIHLELPIIYTI